MEDRRVSLAIGQDRAGQDSGEQTELGKLRDSNMDTYRFLPLLIIPPPDPIYTQHFPFPQQQNSLQKFPPTLPMVVSCHVL
jgi:hypothetical protein